MKAVTHFRSSGILTDATSQLHISMAQCSFHLPPNERVFLTWEYYSDYMDSCSFNKVGIIVLFIQHFWGVFVTYPVAVVTSSWMNICLVRNTLLSIFRTFSEPSCLVCHNYQLETSIYHCALRLGKCLNCLRLAESSDNFLAGYPRQVQSGIQTNLSSSLVVSLIGHRPITNINPLKE